MRKYLYTLGLIWFALAASAQNKVFVAEEVETPGSAVLDANFYRYQVVRLDLATLYAQTQQSPDAFRLNWRLGATSSAEFILNYHNLQAPGYQLRLATPRGIEVAAPHRVGTYRGIVNGSAGGEVRLTITPELCFGWWAQDGETYFIEPLRRLDPTADPALHLVYREGDTKAPAEDWCGLAATRHHEAELHAKPADGEKIGQCYITEVALAADNSIRVANGSVPGAEAFMFGVLNNVQGNFDNEFADEIQFQVITTFVSTCSTCDPWTNSTNAGALLNDFADWGNGGGFGTTEYDVASVWTNRDFNGGTIGVAWVGGLCTDLRYNALQSFSSNATLLRVLTAHELGHNFGANHDASGSNTIMAPSVNSSNTWSSNSVSQINNVIAASAEPAGCLASCSPPVPPVAAISAPITEVCPGSYLSFFDDSAFNPTSWNWNFPGAQPSSSNQQHPTVVYPNPGVYPVTLTVENGSGVDATILSTDVVVGEFGRKYILYETFEEGSSWSILNPDNDITWSIGSTDGNDGSNAMFVNNYDYDGGQGQIDALVSPPLDLSAEQDVRLQLEYAYRRYNNNGSDRLTIRLSTNGGSTYPIVLFDAFENGSGNFATGPISQAPFFPRFPDDWCFNGPGCIDLDLSAYAGNPNVRIKIENISAYGNNLFVDNIRLSVACQPSLPPFPVFISDLTSGCAPLAVNFQDLSENADAVEWYFEGGTPNFSTSFTPTVTYQTPGTYSVTLIATNSAGSAELTEPAYITVGGPPSPAFGASVNNLEVVFDNLTPDADSYQWDFGDGNGSNLQVPTHTYPAPGTYVVSLTATNACGSATVTEEVVTVSPLTADFTVDTTNGCAPLAVLFTDQSVGGLSRLWSFPGGTPATDTSASPLVTYASPGVYGATLVVTGLGGLTDTLVQNNLVTVGGLPNAGFTTSLVAGDTTAVFNNTSTGADSYLWSFGDGDTSTLANPAHAYAAPGAYTVSLVAANACGADTASLTLTVLWPPTPVITLADTVGCAPLTLTFAAQPQGPGLTYAWSFPGGTPATDTSANPLVTYANPGVYDVTLAVTNAAGTGAVTQTGLVTVLGPPVADFNLDYQPALGLVQVIFSGQGADQLNWTFADGTTATGDSVFHFFSASGLYFVTLVASNACGVDSITYEFEAYQTPSAQVDASLTSGCASLEVTFTAQPQGANHTYSWSFPGGSPGSSTEPSPTVTYTQPGAYDVILVVSNPAGQDTAILTNHIVVQGPPAAGLAVAYTLGANSAQWWSTSVGASQLHWDFGDGATATGDTVVHTYATDGEYLVTLVAENNCGADTIQQSIVILTPPQPNFVADTVSGCAGFAATFAAQPQGPGLTYAWTFPGGIPASSDQPNPTVQYPSPGSYPVTLEVTNAAGSNQLTIDNYIMVSGGPLAGFTFTQNGPTAQFTNQSQDATSYLWDFGDGDASTDPNPVHQYAGEGTYQVTLVATNACGADTSTQTLVIDGNVPVVNFTAENRVGCAPLMVQFTNLSTAGETFLWNFPGGQPATSTEANPVVTYPSPGVFDVTLTATNAFGASALNRVGYVTVNAGPQAGFTFVIATTTVAFTNSSVGATGYFWDFGDGNTSSQPNPVHLYSMGGQYAVTLVAENACGLDTLTQTVAIAGEAPIANFTSDTTYGCIPLTVQFADLSSGDVDSWQWSFPGGQPTTSTEPSPVVVYSEPGIYPVSLTVTNAFGENTLTIDEYVGIEAPPSLLGVTVDQQGNTVQFNAQATGNNLVFEWDFGDGNVGVGEAPSHLYEVEGNYRVVLKLYNNCGSLTEEVAMIEVVIITVSEPTWAEGLTLFPNPSHGRVSLQAERWPAAAELALELYNPLGQRLAQQRWTTTPGAWQQALDWSYLPAGVYLLRLHWEGQTLLRRLVIQ